MPKYLNANSTKTVVLQDIDIIECIFMLLVHIITFALFTSDDQNVVSFAKPIQKRFNLHSQGNWEASITFFSIRQGIPIGINAFEQETLGCCKEFVFRHYMVLKHL